MRTDPSNVDPGTLSPWEAKEAGGLFVEKPAFADTAEEGFLVRKITLRIIPSGSVARGGIGSRMKQSISPSVSVISGEHWPVKSLGKLNCIEFGMELS